jgi:hypothetical protein
VAVPQMSHGRSALLSPVCSSPLSLWWMREECDYQLQMAFPRFTRRGRLGRVDGCGAVVDVRLEDIPEGGVVGLAGLMVGGPRLDRQTTAAVTTGRQQKLGARTNTPAKTGRSRQVKLGNQPDATNHAPSNAGSHKEAARMTAEQVNGDEPLVPMPALTLDALRHAVAAAAPSRLPEFFQDVQDTFSQAGEEDSVVRPGKSGGCHVCELPLSLPVLSAS